MTKQTQINIRLKAAATEIWSSVENQKRKNGKPVFKNLQAFTSNLTRAYHHKLIRGYSPSKRVIWVERDSALAYVRAYVAVARMSNGYCNLRNIPKHNWPTESVNHRPHVDTRKGDRTPAPSHEGTNRSYHRYVLSNGGRVSVIKDDAGDDLFLSDKKAMAVVLKQLCIRLHRVGEDGSMNQVDEETIYGNANK